MLNARSSLLLAAALLCGGVAAADPVAVPATGAVGPVRTDVGDGVCATVVHIAGNTPPFTGAGALTEAITKLNSPVGQASVDVKQSRVYRYARFRNREATSVGDFTQSMAEQFPFDYNFAARVRGYVNVTPANITYSNALYSVAGARLRIGGQSILSFDANEAVRSVRQLRYAQPGLYPIEIIYYANGGIAVLEASSAMSAEAEGPRQSLDTSRFRLIPPENLFSARSGRTRECLECDSDATCGKANYCARDWGGGGPGPDGICQPCETADHCGEACVKCGTGTPVCAQGACVQCAVDADCGDGRVCRANKCVAAPPCGGDKDCPVGKTCDLTTKSCVTKCGSDADCPVGAVCDPARMQCVQTCTDDAQCAPGLQCDKARNRCVASTARYAGGPGCSAAPGQAGGGAGMALLFGVLGLFGLGALGLLRRRRAARAAGALALVFFSLSGGKAHAQISANAQTFQPALGPENVITVEGSRTPQKWQPVLLGLLEYARRPLFLRSASGDILAETVPHMFTAHLLAGLGVHDRLFFGVHLPIILYQGFDRDRTPINDVTESPAVAGFGDLRLFAKAKLVDNQRGGFGLAFAPQISFPTGKGTAFRGNDAFGIEPRFAADYKFQRGAVIAANVGFLGRTSSQVLTNINVGSQFTYGLGGYLPIPHSESVQLLLEMVGRVSVQAEDGGKRYAPLEMYGGVRYAARSGLAVLAGLGGGLTEAVGSPQVRVFAGVGYLPVQREPLRPGELELRVRKSGGGAGIVRAEDKLNCGLTCSAGYPTDTLVTLTAVPDERSVFVGWRGDCSGTDTCQVRVDRQKTVEAIFAKRAEARSTVIIDKSGDGTGLVRSDDEQIDCGARCQATPPQGATVRLTAKPDPGYYFSNWTGPCSGEAPTCTFTASGPTTTVGAVFRKSKIEQQQGRLALKESINFESGKSVILAGSFGLLDEAVLILRRAPEISVRIEGHTDNQPFNKPGGNTRLSQDRARAVVDYLAEHGVDRARLSSEGFGERCPITSNATESGRAMNRRTEFWIVNPGDPPSRQCLAKQRAADEKKQAAPAKPETAKNKGKAQDKAQDKAKDKKRADQKPAR